MSFEAYRVAVRLTLINHVSTGLLSLSRELKGVHGDAMLAQRGIESISAEMTKIARMGALGAGMATVGFGMLATLKGPYEEAKKLAQAKVDFETLNLSSMENAQAYSKAAAMSQKILGTNITDNLKSIHDLHTAFGDLHHAIGSADDFAQFAFAAKVRNGGKDVDGLTYNAVKALEHRGGKVINDNATFHDELSRQSQVYFGSKGKVSPSDFFAASQTGKMAYTLFDKEYLYGQFAAYMQAKSGSTAGTTSMTAFSSLIGGHMDNKAKGFLAQLGLLQVGVSKEQVQLINKSIDGLDLPEKDKAKLRRAEMPLTGGLKDGYATMFAHRPDLFINDVLVPAIKKRFGMDLGNEEIAFLVAKNFNRATSDDIGEHIVNGQKFAKDAGVFGRAAGFGQAYDEYLKSPEGAEIASEEAWKNLKTVIGSIYIKPVTNGLLSLANGLTKLSAWTDAHPALTQTLVYGFIGLAGAMAFGGTVLLMTSAFKGLSLAMNFASVGGIPGIGEAGRNLGIVGTGIGAIGKAIGAFTLVYAAWVAGQAAGGIINDHMPQGWGEKIGEGTAWLLALYGNQEARRALEINHKQDSPQSVDPHTSMPRLNRAPWTPPPSGGQMVQVHTVLNVDGKKIGEAASTYQAKQMNRPPAGPSYFDSSMGLAPVAFTGTPY